MKKSVFWIAVCIVIIFAAQWAMAASFSSARAAMDRHVAGVVETVEQGRWADALERIDAMHREWTRRRSAMMAMADHDEIQRVDVLIHRTQAMAAQQDANAILPELMELKYMIEHIQNRYDFSWFNIL